MKKISDKEILRLAIITVLDTVILQKQSVASTKNKDIREVLINIAKEEKTYLGEFQRILLREDKEHVRELQH